MKRVALVVLAVLSLVGCDVKGEDSPALDVANGTTTSTDAGTTATTSAAAVLPPTAETAAKALYAAWKIDDRATAGKVAAKPAVDELFSRKYTGPDLMFQGCEPTGPGADCFWSYEGGGMTMHVTKEAGGFRVASIEYVAD